MPTYDATNFDPPAPISIVTLRDMQSGATLGDVRLLLDTGADITLLPKAAVERLGVILIGDEQHELMAFDGTRSLASAVTLDVIFLQRAYRGRYLLIDDERGIMGRDILNHLRLLLDGPLLEWSQHTP